MFSSFVLLLQVLGLESPLTTDVLGRVILAQSNIPLVKIHLFFGVSQARTFAP
jgi:hypothetical protein